MDFDLIIFDCDGVLVDSELLSCGCLSQTLASRGIHVEVDTLLDLFLGRSTTAIIDHCRALGWTIPGKFAADLAARICHAFVASLRPIPGVEVVLRTLDTAYCIASSSDREQLAHALALTGLAEFF